MSIEKRKQSKKIITEQQGNEKLIVATSGTQTVVLATIREIRIVQ